jgi:MoxR-like ATPase
LDDATQGKELVLANLAEVQPGEILAETTIDKAVDIVGRTRTHAEVDRGVSTRGTLRYTELMSTLQQIKDRDEEELLRAGAFPSLPHRLELAPHADLPGKREKIVEEILDQALGAEI